MSAPIATWSAPSALTLIPTLIQWLQCCLLFVPPSTIDTHKLSHIRVAILPLCIYGIWMCYSHPEYSYFKPARELMHLNVGTQVSKYLGVIKSIEYALCDEMEFAWMGYDWAYSRQRRRKRDTDSNAADTNGVAPPLLKSEDPGQQYGKNVTEIMWLAWRCMLSMRGIGWSWGLKGEQIPARHPIHNLLPSLMKRMLIFHLLTVIPYAYLQFYREAGVGSHLLAFPIALLARLSRVAALGLAIGGSIELQFTYLTLAAYAFTAFWRAIIPESPDGLFSYIRPDPFRIEAWPKPSIRPWMADSVTELWGKRWHPLFRRPLVAVGGRPLIKLAHTLGFKSQVATSICAATGAFFLSGFIHEHINDISPWLPRDAAYRSMTFFMLQPLAVVLESIFQELTGRKVGGMFGRVWTWSFLLISGLVLTECWLERGFADVFPPLAEWEWWRYAIPQAVTFPNLSKPRAYLLHEEKERV